MEWLSLLLKGYIYLTAALLVAIGATLFLVTWTCEVRVIQSFLNAPAPFWGFSNRAILLLAGPLQLLFAGCLFVTRNLMTQMGTVLWMGLNYLIYRVAMVWTTYMTFPLPREEFVGWRLGVRKETVDFCWKLFIAYLVIGSSMLMLLKMFLYWRLEKQLKNEAWVKHWQESRDQVHLQAKPANPKPPANASSYLKISCYHCGGHIEFPSNAIGERISCPHCKINILLNEPA